jgi:hypothetical protein
VLLLWPRVKSKVPPPIVALTVAALTAVALARSVPGFSVATINTRFSYEAAGVRRPGIPREPPRPVLPWRLPGPDGAPLRALARAGWRNRKGRLRIFRSFERGIALARRTALQFPVDRRGPTASLPEG